MSVKRGCELWWLDRGAFLCRGFSGLVFSLSCLLVVNSQVHRLLLHSSPLHQPSMRCSRIIESLARCIHSQVRGDRCLSPCLSWHLQLATCSMGTSVFLRDVPHFGTCVHTNTWGRPRRTTSFAFYFALDFRYLGLPLILVDLLCGSSCAIAIGAMLYTHTKVRVRR